MTPSQEWAVYISVAAAAISVISIFISAFALGESKKTRDMQHFYNIFKDILALEEKQKDYIAKREQEVWNSLFFNTLEYFCFLINQKLLPEKPLAFFQDAIIQWYENIFLRVMPKEKLESPKKYPELKALYRRCQKQ
jgi:hypothetical protein